MNANKNICEHLDIEFFQTLQDKLAIEFGIASIITDKDGKPLTKQSNFSEFCSELTRKTEIGLKRCMKCDAYGGKMAKELKKPVIYRCHAGLIDFASPIIIKNEIVGCFLCGQILEENPNEEHFRKIANEIGINEEKYITALRKVKIIPYDKIEYAANFLYELSSKLSIFSDYQDTGMKTRQGYYHSIENFNNFIASLKSINLIANNGVSNSYSFFEKILTTLFKDFNIDDKKIKNMQKNIDFISKKTKNISERIKNTEKHYYSIDINKLKETKN